MPNGSPAAGSARRQQLLPRVKASERQLPLCAADKKCDLCETLRGFVGGSLAQMYLAGLGKAKQQHVRQVVGWLAAPEGGGHALSITDGPGGTGGFVRGCAGSLWGLTAERWSFGSWLAAPEGGGHAISITDGPVGSGLLPPKGPLNGPSRGTMAIGLSIGGIGSMGAASRACSEHNIHARYCTACKVQGAHVNWGPEVSRQSSKGGRKVYMAFQSRATWPYVGLL
jgi:hypothetical protein